MHIDLQSEKTTGISAARHIRSFNEAENVLVTSNFITTGNKYQHYFCLSLPLDKQSTVETIFVFDREQMQSVSISIPEYWIGKKSFVYLIVVSVYSLKSFSGNSFTSSVEASVTEDKGQEFFMTLTTEHQGNIFINCESEMNGII